MGLFEEEMRNLDKKPINRQNEGHTLSDEQLEDLRKIQNKNRNKKSGWF